MAKIDVLKYLFLFILLTSVVCLKWPEYDWDENCSSEEHHCFCGFHPEKENEMLLNCDNSHSIKDHVSQLRNNQYMNNLTLHIRFFDYEKTPNELSSNTFEGLNISTLVFENCNIIKWSDEEGAPAFVGLEDTLEYLKIWDYIRRSYSYDNEVSKFTIFHLRSLKELDLRGIRLSMFEDNWLGGGLDDSVKKVEVLKGQGYWYASSDFFSSLRKLEYIDLSHNSMREISRSLFPNPATYLKEMDLRYNRISVLPRDFFENMPALMNVTLNANEIYVIDESTWSPVWSQLQYLDIRQPYLYCQDEYIEWMFKMKRPLFLSGKCRLPRELDRKELKTIIDEKQQEIQ